MLRTRFLLIGAVLALARATEVDVPGLGRLKGTTTLTQWTQQKVFEFRAVPYAVAPSGARRFKYPEKFSGWLGTRDATLYGQACPQPGVSAAVAPLYGQFLSHDEDTLPRRASADPEDCLTLDVYTKKIGSSELRPVFVAIHGGSFLSGMSSSLKPGFLLEKDIVLVVPQYRLGPLGFLSLGTSEAPGNAGLMDLVLALEWVRDHVAAFGGDPGKVTVGGNSAGGASTSLLMLNARAAPLFHRVLPQSGPALAFWALDRSRSTKPASDLALEANCSPGPAAVLLACLRSKSVAQITNAYIAYALKVYASGDLGMKNSMPVIQEVGVGERVVDRDPVEVFRAGAFNAMPALVTVVKHEGIFDLDLMYQSFLLPNGLHNNDTYLREDVLLDFLRVLGVDDFTGVFSDSLMSKYMDEADVGNFSRMTPSLIDVTGTLSHKAPSFAQAHSHASKANTYLLTFDYHGEHTLHDDTPTSVPIPGGITHSDELIYLYPREGRKLNDEDTKIAKLMVQIFTNFIISGNPSSIPLEGVPEWPHLSGLQRHVLSVRNGGKHELFDDYRRTYTAAKDEGLVLKGSAPLLSSSTLTLLLAFATLILLRR
ncbi:carboxylesterase 1E-like [Neocloeon triangulifer]|uniref:carboxylesterase 1E-like n=1 Tax=Neocloeon triangulifer TaxID=2078957 RepID=UPI00286ED9BD|nr:carboxylesterase 1E-like [Neocloeon triangulifer]